MKKLLFFTMIMGSLISLNIVQADSLSEKPTLTLPQTLLELKVTSQQQLGTRENDLGLPIGAKVSDFKIKTYDGQPVTLTELMKNAPLIVIFYRGGWCPFCNFQIRELSQAYPAFQKQGVELVLISVDEVQGATLVKKSYEIPFPVLSDPDLIAHETFKVTLQIDNATFKRYKNEYQIDLEAWSKQQHHKIGIPSIFLIDKTRTIQWAHLALDYTIRPNPAQLLKVIANWKPGNN